MPFGSTIVNLAPLQDRVVIFKKCDLPCEEACGVCEQCDTACPPDCLAGVESGYGHVWKLRDRIPAFLVTELVTIFQERQAVMSTAEGFQYFADAITKLVRRSYPAVDAAKLHEALDLEDYPVILAHFLNPLVQAGTPPATVDQPVATPTSTRKPRRTSPRR